MSAKDSGFVDTWSDPLLQPESSSDPILFTYFDTNKSPRPQEPGHLAYHPFSSYREPACLSVSGLESAPDHTIRSPLDDSQEHEIDQNLPPPESSLAGVFAGNDPYNMNPQYLDPADHSMIQNITLDSDLPPIFSEYGPIPSDNDEPWTYLQNQYSKDTMTPTPDAHHGHQHPTRRRRRVDHDHDSAVGALSTPNPSELGYPSAPMRHIQTQNLPQQATSGRRHMQRPSLASSQRSHGPLARSVSSRYSTDDQYSQQLHAPTSTPGGSQGSRKHVCPLCTQDPPKAFGTVNDLARHTRGVHSVFEPGEKIWRCKIPNCTVPEKLWPRRDNFVSHLRRMHLNDDAEAANREAEQFQELYDPNVHKPVMPGTILDVDNNTSTYTNNPATNDKKRQRDMSSPASSHEVGEHRNVRHRPFAPLSGEASPLNRGFNQPGGVRSQLRGASFANHAHNQTVYGNVQGPSLALPPRFAFTAQQPLRGLSNALRLRNARTEPDPESLSLLNEVFQDRQAQQQMDRISPSDQDLAGTGDNLTIDPAILSSTMQTSASPAIGNLEYTRPTFEDEYDEIFRRLTREEKAKILGITTSAPIADADPTLFERSVSKSPTKEVADEQKKWRCLDLIIKKGVCVTCQSAFATASELKKHRKRHQKRFGCTFDRCYSKFGTKWEWKRHELKQHIQHEAWRCHYLGDVDSCQQLFNDQEAFKNHLYSHYHQSDSSAIEQDMKDCHLEKKWLGSYWCGHCRRIIETSPHCEYGKEMIDDRFEHVGGHVLAGKDPLAWIELAANGKAKGDVKRSYETAGTSATASQLGALNGQSANGCDEEDDSDSEESSDSGATSRRPYQTEASRPERAPVEVNTHLSDRRGSQAGPSPTTPTVRVLSPNGVVTQFMLEDDDVDNMTPSHVFAGSGDLFNQQSGRRFGVICCQCDRKTHTDVQGMCDHEDCHHQICSECMPLPQQRPRQQVQQQRQQGLRHNDYIGKPGADSGYGYLGI